MKKRTLWALLLCLTMLASLLAGCGGEKKETAEDGRGDVIEEEPSSDPGDTLDEPEVNFEDFFGCWEYLDYDVWLYVYGDGTYEMYNEDGDCTAGSYTPEGTEIVLDSGERFALDGDGGLIDGEGDGLFASELPDFTPNYYFDEYEIGINYELGQGNATLEDGAYYFEMNTDGQYYNVGPLVCSVDLESERDLGNGYVERVVTLYRGFTEEDIPMFTIGVSMGASLRLLHRRSPAGQRQLRDQRRELLLRVRHPRGGGGTGHRRGEQPAERRGGLPQHLCRNHHHHGPRLV